MQVKMMGAQGKGSRQLHVWFLPAQKKQYNKIIKTNSLFISYFTFSSAIAY